MRGEQVAEQAGRKGGAEAAPVVLVAAVPGDKPVELALHKELAAVRLDGEWFKTSTTYVVRRMASAALEAS